MEPEPRSPWPKSAQVAFASALGAFLLVFSLWLVDVRPWGGVYDAAKVGTAAAWFSAFSTLAAIAIAGRQFLRQQASDRRTEARYQHDKALDELKERRKEALAVSAWATWDAGKGRQRAVHVANDSRSTIFAWSVTVIPGNRFPYYGRIENHLPGFGSLRPGGGYECDLTDRTSAAKVVRVERPGYVDVPGPPQFVVLEFVDPLGANWHQCNGDLRELPPQSLLIPRPVHLRNASLPWAGVIDSFMWEGFRRAVVATTSAPGLADSLAVLPMSSHPYLDQDEAIRLWKELGPLPLAHTGAFEFTYEPRMLTRKVDCGDAYRAVRTFFETVVSAQKGAVLYVRGD